MQRVSSSNASAFQGSLINSEELKAGKAESTVEMSTLCEKVRSAFPRAETKATILGTAKTTSQIKCIKNQNV